jgi:hypothetical protein
LQNKNERDDGDVANAAAAAAANNEGDDADVGDYYYQRIGDRFSDLAAVSGLSPKGTKKKRETQKAPRRKPQVDLLGNLIPSQREIVTI